MFGFYDRVFSNKVIKQEIPVTLKDDTNCIIF